MLKENEIKLKKNYKFEDGYNIKGREGVFFFKDAKVKEEKVAVPYVYYSRSYRKYYEDTCNFSISEYEIIKKCNPNVFKE